MSAATPRDAEADGERAPDEGKKLVVVSWNVSASKGQGASPSDYQAMINQMETMESAGSSPDLVIFQDPVSRDVFDFAPFRKYGRAFLAREGVWELAIFWKQDVFEEVKSYAELNDRMLIVTLNVKGSGGSGGGADPNKTKQVAAISYHAPSLENEPDASVACLTEVCDLLNRLCEGTLKGADVYMGGDFNCDVPRHISRLPRPLHGFQIVAPAVPKAREQLRETGPLAGFEIDYMLYKVADPRTRTTTYAYYPQEPNPGRTTKHFPLVCTFTHLT